MTINKLAIIGGSGLYDVEEFKDRELLDLNSPWGKPSDQILKTNFKNKEVKSIDRNNGINYKNIDDYNTIYNNSELLNLKDKDPSEMGFKNFWNLLDKSSQTKFSDIVKGRLNA